MLHEKIIILNCFPKYYLLNNLSSGAGGAGVVGGLGALFAAGGFGAYKFNEASEQNTVLHDFVDFNNDYKDYSNKINDILLGIDASKLRLALEDTEEAVNVNIDHKDLEYYFGEILEMSKENLGEAEKIIRDLQRTFTASDTSDTSPTQLDMRENNVDVTE